MAKKNKTSETKISVIAFLDSFVDNEQKKTDSLQLIALMREWSGFEPKMWGPTMIGFGTYHYKYASGHEGDAFLIGFSPRKAEFSLYAYTGLQEHEHLLQKLGKFRTGKVCIYFKKLSDLNIPALKKLCKTSIEYVNAHYKSSSTK